MPEKLVIQAVRRTIQQNELERSRHLAEWLELIAAEFGRYGLEVEDLRMFARFLRGPSGRPGHV
jgi:hypothetical protein